MCYFLLSTDSSSVCSSEHELQRAVLSASPRDGREDVLPEEARGRSRGCEAGRAVWISPPFPSAISGWSALPLWASPSSSAKCEIIKTYPWASLVAQWLRVHLLMQRTRVRALVWEDPTCRRATGPVSHNYWACASGACALQQERPWSWEARAPRRRVAPACHN